MITWPEFMFLLSLCELSSANFRLPTGNVYHGKGGRQDTYIVFHIVLVCYKNLIFPRRSYNAVLARYKRKKDCANRSRGYGVTLSILRSTIRISEKSVRNFLLKIVLGTLLFTWPKIVRCCVSEINAKN